MKFLFKNFMRGLLISAPVYLTLYVVFWAFRKLDNVGAALLSHLWDPPLVRGIGFAFMVLLIVAIGYFSSLWLGELFLSWIEKTFSRSPFLMGIYSTTRDTLQSLFGDKKSFSRTVLVDYPVQGFQRIGFLMNEKFEWSGEQDRVVVYLPQSFNIAGEMVVVPRSQVTFLDIPPETALKMILSGGIVNQEKK